MDWWPLLETGAECTRYPLQDLQLGRDLVSARGGCRPHTVATKRRRDLLQQP